MKDYLLLKKSQMLKKRFSLKKCLLYYCISILSIQGVFLEINGQSTVIRSFPVEKEIIGKGMELYLRIDFIGLIDNVLIVIQMDGSSIFNLYRTDDLTAIRRFGVRGKGPNEFLGYIYFSNQVYKENGEIRFWVFDSQSRKFQLVAIAEDPQKRGMQIKKQLLLSPETRSEFGVIYINDTLVIGTSSNENERYSWNERGPFTKMHHFFRFNPQNGNILWTKPYPLVEFDGNYNCGNIYQDKPILKPDGKKIACPSTFFDQIVIYNLDGQELTRIVSPNKAPKLFLPNQQGWLQNNYFYYTAGYASNNFIYLIYQKENGDKLRSEEVKSEIHVFNWNGEGICRYKTDLLLSNIVVDEHQRIIYAGQVGITGDLAIFNIGSELNFSK